MSSQLFSPPISSSAAARVAATTAAERVSISPRDHSPGAAVLHGDRTLLEEEEPAVVRVGGMGPAQPLLHHHPEHLRRRQALQEGAGAAIHAVQEASHVEELVEGLGSAGAGAGASERNAEKEEKRREQTKVS